MDDELERSIRELIDRQAIVSCLHRYARGLDRKDLDLLRSAYHPDAIDHHGSTGDYSPEGLITSWLERDADREFSHHLILNSSIEIDADSAHAETYFQVIVGLTPDAALASGRPRLTAGGGRYVDRFEKRDGEWRIARRVVISEFQSELNEITNPGLLAWARRSKADPSYARPLLGPPTD